MHYEFNDVKNSRSRAVILCYWLVMIVGGAINSAKSVVTTWFGSLSGGRS